MTSQDAREHVNRALETLAGELDAGHSDALKAYLSTMGRFHRYNRGNQLLIAAQMPTARNVAAFGTWKELGRYVRRGEHGIMILAPIAPKLQKTEDEDGNETILRPRASRFRVAYVFDVGQTDGQELPAPAQVAGDPGEYLARLEGFVRGRGIRLEYRENLGRALGQSSGGFIEIRSGIPAAQTFSTLAHETSHELLHWDVPDEIRADKTLVETQAEAVAFVVCSAVGLKTNTAASDYIQLYRGNRDTLRLSLAAIHRAVGQILAAILPPDGRAAAPQPTTEDAHARRGGHLVSPFSFAREAPTGPALGSFVQVKDIPEEARFITHEEEVRELNVLYAKRTKEYDAFFVVASDGAIAAVYGMHGTVPWLDRETVLLF